MLCLSCTPLSDHLGIITNSLLRTALVNADVLGFFVMVRTIFHIDARLR